MLPPIDLVEGRKETKIASEQLIIPNIVLSSFPQQTIQTLQYNSGYEIVENFLTDITHWIIQDFHQYNAATQFFHYPMSPGHLLVIWAEDTMSFIHSFATFLGIVCVILYQ